MKHWLIPLGFLASVAAYAQEAPTAAERAACRADVQKFCPDVKPGGGRIIACLREHKDQISQGCGEAMASHAHKPPATGAGGGNDAPPPPKPQ